MSRVIFSIRHTLGMEKAPQMVYAQASYPHHIMQCLYDLPKAQYEALLRAAGKQLWCNCHRCGMQNYRVAAKGSVEYGQQDAEPSYMQSSFTNWLYGLMNAPSVPESRFEPLWRHNHQANE